MTKENQDNGKREKELIDEMIARHGHSPAAILGQKRWLKFRTKQRTDPGRQPHGQSAPECHAHDRAPNR